MRALGLPVLVVLALALPAPAWAIVGGETTQREWPHMAAMEYRDPETGEWGLRCGASLIRSDVLLTAAHCVDDEETGGTLPSSRFRFLLGTMKRSAGGERIAAARILEHPGYDESQDTTASDVALVKLATPSTLGRTIRIAEPADAPFWEPGDPAVVTGWGTEFFSSPFVPDDLKEAEVPIVSDADCERSYQLTLGFDAPTSVCAGNLYGGEDSCQGDSGGPLHVRDASGAWIQVGVVSFGLGCAFPTQYGVYSEAGGDALRGWITTNGDAMATHAAPAPSPSPSTASPSSSSALAPLRTRLVLPSSLRVVRRGRRASVTLRTTGPLRSVAVALRRDRRTLASGRRASLRGSRGRVLLRARTRRAVRTLRRSRRATLRVTAVDASGRRVVATRVVRLRRR